MAVVWTRRPTSRNEVDRQQRYRGTDLAKPRAASTPATTSKRAQGKRTHRPPRQLIPPRWHQCISTRGSLAQIASYAGRNRCAKPSRLGSEPASRRPCLGQEQQRDKSCWWRLSHPRPSHHDPSRDCRPEGSEGHLAGLWRARGGGCGAEGGHRVAGQRLPASHWRRNGPECSGEWVISLGCPKRVGHRSPANARRGRER